MSIKLYMAPGIIPIRQLLGLGFSTANLVYLWYSLSIYLVFRNKHHMTNMDAYIVKSGFKISGFY